MTRQQVFSPRIPGITERYAPSSLPLQPQGDTCPPPASRGSHHEPFTEPMAPAAGRRTGSGWITTVCIMTIIPVIMFPKHRYCSLISQSTAGRLAVEELLRGTQARISQEALISADRALTRLSAGYLTLASPAFAVWWCQASIQPAACHTVLQRCSLACRHHQPVSAQALLNFNVHPPNCQATTISYYASNAE